MRKTPKLVLADKRKWARGFYLGDNKPEEFPQAMDKIAEQSFAVLTAHNTTQYEIGQHLSPDEVDRLLNGGWAVDIKPYKED